MSKKIFLGSLVVILAVASYFVFFNPNNEIIILHTNDVHTAVDKNIGYAGFSAYIKDMEAEYGEDNVVVVDIGDTIHGDSIGTLTSGGAAITIMNAVGYDYFALGNHEFDFNLPRLFELANRLDAKILAANFIDLNTNEPVFSPYDIRTINDVDVAFIGLSTPETMVTSTPKYFQNEQGEFIYSFLGNTDDENHVERFYNTIQSTVDKARAEGADYVVVLGHLGIEELTAPYRSIDVIENTTGIDVLLDGESHSIVENKLVKNKAGQNVVLAQAGSHLEYFGVLTIDPDSGTIVSEIVGSEYTKKDPEIENAIKVLNEQLESRLYTVIAESKHTLVSNVDHKEIVRLKETNAGNFVADAYRYMLNSDIGLSNGGSIRANIEAGPVSYKSIIDLAPFNNQVHIVQVSGRTIRDALEMGVRKYPAADGAFFQVSGITFEVNSSIPSSVVINEQGNFVKVAGEYRVENIKVAGKAIDLESSYTIAGSDYFLFNQGDGMSMFKNHVRVRSDYLTDHDLLTKYITERLDGVIGDEYANPNGEGRIIIR